MLTKNNTKFAITYKNGYKKYTTIIGEIHEQSECKIKNEEENDVN